MLLQNNNRNNHTRNKQQKGYPETPANPRPLLGLSLLTGQPAISM